MKKWMRNLGIALAVLFTLSFATSLYYYMPRAVKAKITGTEVKRMDQKAGDPATAKTRDVRFVYATSVESGKPLAFRNEDNGWYFKFNSGDIAAQASSVVQEDKDAIVLVKYYGERVPIMDLYPNILSMKKVEADYVYIPIVNIIVLILLLAFVIWGGVKVRKLFRAAKDKTQKLVHRGES